MGHTYLLRLKFMSDIRGVLIDLDGVMYTGRTPVPGAREAISILEERGFSYRFLSNTTRNCRHTIAQKLALMGLPIPESLIFTPAVAASRYLKNSGRHNYRFLITGDVIRDFPKNERKSQQQKTDLVIIGDAGDEFTYANLNGAFRDLVDGADLIALERDQYWMTSEGLSLSAGPFVTALESATGKKALLMGKPSRAFFDLALGDMGLEARDAVMIGDDIATDVGGAQEAGLRGVLVRTGKYREDIAKKSAIRPDMVLDSIADIEKVVEAADLGRWER